MATVTQDPSASSWTPPNIWASIRALIASLVPTLFSVDGAVNPFIASTNYITKAGSANLTLAAPIATVQDGNIIRINSTTAFAHVLSAIGLLQTGTAAVNYVTFSAYPGSSVTLQAYQGKWIVIGYNQVSFQ
jgi:hypothetical protein